MAAQVIRSGERRRVPWRNGAGITEEVATGPDGPSGRPLWRLSVADLGSDPSEFSAFPGRDRIFTVIGEHGVDLDWGHGPHSLDPWHPHSFAGEDAPHCVPRGATRAFNVMTERGGATAAVGYFTLDTAFDTAADRVSALYVRSGSVQAGTERAAPGDCVLIRGEAITLRGSSATGLLVRIEPTSSL
ncbi:HutD/Ves family protein [Rhodococcus rhodochrous]|uniref:HutD family protein n=1 Tax=Rhodococcus rhodochrous TaxID=1829 RepID=A0AA46WZN8_RHORH|nr:HutD family protein [Rhodococcus rhodochrous]MDJ0396936.1 HutD family protein [Rhodococcus rhodochrous]UZF46930.1 HutD family protein [Rhodococcus rhodochrous]